MAAINSMRRYTPPLRGTVTSSSGIELTPIIRKRGHSTKELDLTGHPQVPDDISEYTHLEVLRLDEHNLRSVTALQKLEGKNVTVYLGSKAFTDFEKLRWQILHKAVYHHNRDMKTDWNWAREHLGIDPRDMDGNISWEQLDQALNKLPGINFMRRLSHIPIEQIVSFLGPSSLRRVSRQFANAIQIKEKEFVCGAHKLPWPWQVELVGMSKATLNEQGGINAYVRKKFWNDPELSATTNRSLDKVLKTLPPDRWLLRCYEKLPDKVKETLSISFPKDGSVSTKAKLIREAFSRDDLDFSEVKILNFTWVNIYYVPKSILRHFPKLEELKLKNCSLVTLEGLPESLDKLRVLDISQNHLSNFTGLPKKLPNLWSLEARWNQLHSKEGLPKASELPCLGEFKVGRERLFLFPYGSDHFAFLTRKLPTVY